MIYHYLTNATTKSLLVLTGVISTILLGVGCGGSGSSTSNASSTTTTASLTTSTLTTSSVNIGELCSTSCTDGTGDTISQVRLLSSDLAHTASTDSEARVVSFQLTLKNESSGVATIDLLAELKILDSEQHQLGLDPEVTDSAYRIVAACEDIADEVTLEPGEMHSFTVCFDLPSSKDFPRAALIDSGAVEIPFK